MLRDAANRAVDLARALPGGSATLYASRAEALPAAPLAAFAAAAGQGRLLLWQGDSWLLATGVCRAMQASGPGRTYHLAESVSTLRSQTVTVGGELLLCVQQSFESRPPGPSAWGPALPGSRLLLPRHLLWRRSADDCRRIAALPVNEADRPVDLANRLYDEAVPLLPPTPTEPWLASTSPAYTELVGDALDLLRHGIMRKVVLARSADHRFITAIDLLQALDHLHHHADERTYVYAVDLPDGACFIGATPELLFETQGAACSALSLAGSRARHSDPARDRVLADELLASTKERKEHQLVVEHLQRVLEPRCSELRIPSSPTIRQLARLQHLETTLTGQLIDPDPFDVLGSLQPTPAVAGLPVDAAQAFIARHEGLHRGLYTGSLGLLHADTARFIVPLRGGIVSPDRQQARCFAGAGIVESSEAQAEWDETELKLRPMRQALGIE